MKWSSYRGYRTCVSDWRSRIRIGSLLNPHQVQTNIFKYFLLIWLCLLFVNIEWMIIKWDSSSLRLILSHMSVILNPPSFHCSPCQYWCWDAFWWLKIHGNPCMDWEHQRFHEVQQEKGWPACATRGGRHGYQRCDCSSSSFLNFSKCFLMTTGTVTSLLTRLGSLLSSALSAACL